MADGDVTFSLDQLPQMMQRQGGAPPAPANLPPQQRLGAAPATGDTTFSLDQLQQKMQEQARPSEEQAIGTLQHLVNQPKSWETKLGELAIPTGTGLAGGTLGATLAGKPGAAVGAGIGQTIGEEITRSIERYMHGQETDPAEVEGLANKLGLPLDRHKLELLKSAGVNISLNAAVDWLLPQLKYMLGGKSAESMLNEVYGLGEQKVAEFGQTAQSAERTVAARLAAATGREAEKVAPAARLEQIASETGRTPETAAATQMSSQPSELTPVGEHLQYQAPPNFGVDLSSPQQIAQWAQSASPEEKQAMKEILGDKMAAGPDRLANNDRTQAQMWAQAWRSIDPKSKFANPDNILFVNGKVNALMASPENYQRFLEGAGKAAQPIFDQGAQMEVNAGRKILQDFGILGKQTLREVDAAADQGPQAQALIMRKFFQSLDRPGMAAQIHGLSGTFNRPVPEQILKSAGLTEPVDKYMPRGLSRAQRPGALPWIIASGGVSAVTGHTPTFLLMLGGYGGYQAGKRWLANNLIKEMTARVAGQSAKLTGEGALISSIAGPYADAAISNLSNEAWESLGEIVFKHASADVSKQTAEYYGPKAAAVAEEKFGPMVKDIGRTVAKNIAAPERRIDSTHIDNVQKTNEAVQSGKTPDIQRDLNSGRLSVAEARRMVEATGTDPGSMFKNMTLDEAVDAFIKGTDDEKGIALAPLAQKLNDEGRSLPPEQRRAYMARIRQALPQGEESMPGPGQVAVGGGS